MHAGAGERAMRATRAGKLDGAARTDLPMHAGAGERAMHATRAGKLDGAARTNLPMHAGAGEQASLAAVIPSRCPASLPR
jgi:hypothetical protein